MATIVIDKFTGGLRSPDFTSRTQMDTTECEDALNVEFYPRGTVSQRKGYGAALVSRVGSGCTRLYKWKDTSNTDFQLGFTCLSGTGATATSATVINISTNPYAATVILSAGSGGWNPAYDDSISCTSYLGSAATTYRDSLGASVFWTGSGLAAAQSTMQSGCSIIQGWGNYLFIGNYQVGGIRNGSRLAWNSAMNVSSWPAASYIDLDPDDADEITAVELLGDYLVIFKRKKIFIIYWVGGTLQFKEARRSATIGCVGPNAVVNLEGRLVFLSTEGVYSFDGTGVKEVSRKIRPLFQDLNPTYLHISEAFKYDLKRQIWFCVATGSSITKNKIYAWDYELDNWTVFDIDCSATAYMTDATTKTYADLDVYYYQETQTFDSYKIVGSDVIILGFLNGDIHEYGNASDDDGTAIASTWKSTWIDAGDPTFNKRILRLTLLLDRKSYGDLLLDLQEDWKNIPVDDSTQGWDGTQTIAMTGTSTADLLEKRIDKTRQARAFQIVLSGDSAGRPWTLHKIMMDVVPKGKTLVT